MSFDLTVMVDVSSFTIGSTGDLVLLIDSDDGDYFTLGSFVPGNELPIELLSFEAKRKDDIVEVDWSTASEINNNYFTILRSLNGSNWNAIGNVEGAGNSTSTLTYQFIDNEPINGTSFYQLKQTDFNGDYALSNIAIVQYESTDNDLQIFPNPTEGLITIFAKEEEIDQVKIYNTIGQDITNQIVINYISNTQMSVDLSGLSSGYYFIRSKSNIEKISKE